MTSSNLKQAKVKQAPHICKWKRHTYETGSKIFFCALPRCNKKTKLGLALGKECICWRCGEVFIMNEYSIRLAKPHCEDCHKSKEQTHKDNYSSEFKYQPENSVIPIENPELVKQLVDTGIPPNSLIERLKQATKQTSEDEEEI